MSVNANSPQPRWPAWGHDHRWAWHLQSIEPLRTVKTDYLQKGSLHAVKILDSNLNLFSVVDARTLGRAGIFGWRPGFAGTYLRVDPVFRLDRQLDLAEAKRYVAEFISNHPEVYGSEMSPTQVVSAVRGAASTEELISFL